MPTKRIRVISDLLEMGTIGDCRIMTVKQFEQEILEKLFNS